MDFEGIQPKSEKCKKIETGSLFDCNKLPVFYFIFTKDFLWLLKKSSHFALAPSDTQSHKA